MSNNIQSPIGTRTSSGSNGELNGITTYNKASTALAVFTGPQAPSRIVPYQKNKKGEISECDYSEGDIERFPMDAFPQALRTVADNMARVYQTPACLPAMSALAVLSAAAGASVVVRGGYKDKNTRLNLYVVPVAERGSGKGVIGEALCKPIQERSTSMAAAQRSATASVRAEYGLCKKEINRLEQSNLKSGVDRDNLLATISSKYERLTLLEAEIAREATLLVGDITSEALGRSAQDNNEVLFSFSSEAGAIVKVALGKYTDQGDFDLLLSMYSGDSIRVNRIGRRFVELKNPCLTTLWMAQGYVVRELVGDAEAFARGLTARMLIFNTGARRVKDNRSTEEFDLADTWSAFINEVLDKRFSGKHLEIMATPEAREIFAHLHDATVELEDSQFADVVGELSRWRENAIKIAGLFAIADDMGKVTGEHAARAVRVVRWCGFSYLSMLQAGRKERYRDELSRILEVLSQNNEGINISELQKRHGIKREQLNAVMAAYPGVLEIHTKKLIGAGRPEQILSRFAGNIL